VVQKVRFIQLSIPGKDRTGLTAVHRDAVTVAHVSSQNQGLNFKTGYIWNRLSHRCMPYMVMCFVLRFSCRPCRSRALVFSVLAATVCLQAQPGTHLFTGGTEGYACFRIPAIIVTPKGTLLAFAEGRKAHCGDAGDIDLVMKRSADGGKTWSALQVIWSDSNNTCGNPAPVVDGSTGNILLLSTRNLSTDREQMIIDGISKDTRRIFVLKSTDDGLSWTIPKEITAQVKAPGWTWYATGPGNGIQLRSGKYKNRLVIPCDHIEAGTKKFFSHVIYSNNGGETWALGGTTPSDQVNECAVAVLPDGALMLNMRNYNQSHNRRVALSRDGGISWGALTTDTTLVEPICQASLIAYLGKKHPHCLAFSNPASSTSRIRMTVRLSYDGGNTWPKKRTLFEGPAAYSNLVALPNGNLACLYEAGTKSAYETIVFEGLEFSGFR